MAAQTTGRKKRQYSDEDKAAALAALDANGGNLSRTAKEFDIPKTTLIEWRDGRNQHPVVSDLRTVKKQSLAELFEEAARAYIARALDTDAVSDTRGKDAIIAAATALDKLQLLTGQDTERVASRILVTYGTDGGDDAPDA
jgi:transposase-like protein